MSLCCQLFCRAPSGIETQLQTSDTNFLTSNYRKGGVNGV